MSDGYEVLGELGRGGMGVVHRARDPRLGREVAIKRFLGDWRHDPESQARFAREAQVLARLNHPNVVRVHAYRAEGEPYLVMDLLTGGSLAARLRGGKPLALPEALAVLEQVGAGLAAAHAAGVLHRDLKPANVLFAEAGHAVLTDFGLARSADAQSLTQTGEILGTPAYMPPEQASGDRRALGPASDVYALGALGYALVTGRAPFEGRTLVNVLHQVLEDPPTPPRTLRPDLPPAVEAVLLRCLRKPPRERFATVEAFLEALREAAAKPAAVPAAWRWALPLGVGLAVLAGGWWALPAAPSTPAPVASPSPQQDPSPRPTPAASGTPRGEPTSEALERAIAKALPALELDPRYHAVAGSLEERQGGPTQRHVTPSVEELEHALEAALRELRPSSEAANRCRLALIQVLHVLHSERFGARSEALLRELPPELQDTPLGRYVHMIQRAHFDRPRDLTGFYRDMLTALTVEPTSAALDHSAAQAAWRLSELTSDPLEVERSIHTAQRLAQQAIARAADDPLRARQLSEAHHLLGRIAQKQHRYRDARLEFERCTEADPTWVGAWTALAEYLAWLGARDQAAACYDHMSFDAKRTLQQALEPGGVLSYATSTAARRAFYIEEAERVGQAKGLDAALEIWEKALGLDPDDQQILELRFDACVFNQRHAEVIATYELLAEDRRHPDMTASYVNSKRELAEAERR